MIEVLVTGGAGRLGANLSSSVHDRGHSVRVMDVPDAPFEQFEGIDRYRIIKEDIRDSNAVNDAVNGVSVVYHLAAILPPASEESRERSSEINVTGTRNVVEGCKRARIRHLIFSSSVTVYGDTSADKPPVRVDHPLRALSVYPRTKIEAEKLIIESGVPYTVCRIAGIAVPALLDPPEPWPFMPDQRVEFIAINDLVTALVNLVGNQHATNKTFNLAGGRTWQMTARDYVRRFCETMEIPFENQTWADKPEPFDWYDTGESQRVLRYQNTSFDRFHELLKQAVDDALL